MTGRNSQSWGCEPQIYGTIPQEPPRIIEEAMFRQFPVLTCGALLSLDSRLLET